MTAHDDEINRVIDDFVLASKDYYTAQRKVSKDRKHMDDLNSQQLPTATDDEILQAISDYALDLKNCGTAHHKASEFLNRLSVILVLQPPSERGKLIEYIKGLTGFMNTPPHGGDSTNDH
jgi:hypothetical protein